MSVSPTVMVACDDLILLDEVIRHLEEIPHWRLVMSASSAGELLVSTHQADCVLVSDGVALELADHPRTARLRSEVVAFGRQETTSALRAALKLGARGFVQWPEQREQLRELVERGLVAPAPVATPSGALHAVWAPKGGAGATVIAAHLAGAFARLGEKTILADLDLEHADQTCVLGAEPETKTVGDLLRVADELSPSIVQSVLWSHPLGFDAVLAPGPPGDSGTAGAEIRKVLQALRGIAQHVVVDLPSGDGPVAMAAMDDAACLQVVLTPDVLSLRRARDLLQRLRASGLQKERINVVLNQAGGVDITRKDVQAVLGIQEVTRVRADVQIYRVTNRGELSPLACKLLTPLAKRLSAQVQDATPPATAEKNRRLNPVAVAQKQPLPVTARRTQSAPGGRHPAREQATASFRKGGPAVRGGT